DDDNLLDFEQFLDNMSDIGEDGEASAAEDEEITAAASGGSEREEQQVLGVEAGAPGAPSGRTVAAKVRADAKARMKAAKARAVGKTTGGRGRGRGRPRASPEDIRGTRLQGRGRGQPGQSAVTVSHDTPAEESGSGSDDSELERSQRLLAATSEVVSGTSRRGTSASGNSCLSSSVGPRASCDGPRGGAAMLHSR
ncbi:unnamed protein product, partial [Discosporangium mesarthrocarpum]